MHTLSLYLKLLALVAICFPLSSQNNLTVKIEGIKADKKGTIHLGLFDQGSAFPKSGSQLKGDVIKVMGDSLVYTFQDLPKGQYAITLFHDENNNKQLDTNFFGIPKEGYGFSNNIIPRFGPPDFKDAAIDVSSGNQKVSITVRY